MDGRDRAAKGKTSGDAMSDIREVARRAGVSTSTVSRALSGKIFVREETKKKIMAAVEALNYSPNRAAQGLKEGKSKTLGLIIPDITNPLYPKLVKAVEMRAAELGYTLILFDTDKDVKTEEKYLRALPSHYVGGAIVVTASDDFSHVAELASQNIPVVILNRDFDTDLQCVTNDNENGAYVVTRHLLEHGHKRIACFQVDTELQRYRQRSDGFTRAHQDFNQRIFKKLLVDKVDTAEQAYEATRRLLSQPGPPTAILSFIDVLTFGIYSAVLDCGLRIPDDISVAGFDDIDTSRHMIPPLTTYSHPVRTIADAALSAITAAVEKHESLTGRPNIVVEGSLIVRKSVAYNRLM